MKKTTKEELKRIIMDYWETEPEEEIKEIECPKCRTKLSVAYSISHDFNTYVKEEQKDGGEE